MNTPLAYIRILLNKNLQAEEYIGTADSFCFVGTDRSTLLWMEKVMTLQAQFVNRRQLLIKFAPNSHLSAIT